MSKNVLWKSSKKARKEISILDQNPNAMDFIDDTNDDELLNGELGAVAANNLSEQTKTLSIDDLLLKIEETYAESMKDNERATLEQVSNTLHRNNDSTTEFNNIKQNNSARTVAAVNELTQLSSTSIVQSSSSSSDSSNNLRHNQQQRQQQQKPYSYIGSSFGLEPSTDNTCRPLPCSPLSSWFLCDGKE